MGDFHRPFLVTIIGGLFLILGVIPIITGILVLAFKEITFTGFEGDVRTASAIMAIVLGVLMIVVGFGIFKGIKIMWYVGTILVLISIVADVYSILIYQNYSNLVNAITMFIAIIAIYYMFRPSVKEFFTV